MTWNGSLFFLHIMTHMTLDVGQDSAQNIYSRISIGHFNPLHPLCWQCNTIDTADIQFHIMLLVEARVLNLKQLLLCNNSVAIRLTSIKMGGKK